MMELAKKQSDYTLYKDDDGRLVLTVLCGSAGSYEVDYVLNSGERYSYESNGTGFLDHLAQRVRENPDHYIK